MAFSSSMGGDFRRLRFTDRDFNFVLGCSTFEFFDACGWPSDGLVFEAFVMWLSYTFYRGWC